MLTALATHVNSYLLLIWVGVAKLVTDRLENEKQTTLLQIVAVLAPYVIMAIGFLVALGARTNDLQHTSQITNTNTQQISDLRSEVSDLKLELKEEVDNEKQAHEDLRALAATLAVNTTAQNEHLAAQNDRLIHIEDAIIHDEKSHDEWATAV